MKKLVFPVFIFMIVLSIMFVITLSVSAAQSTVLVIGSNDIKVSAWNEVEVTFTADVAATYTLDLEEGENNAWVMVLTDFGSDDIVLPYKFKLKAGQSKTFIVSTASGSADTVNLVISSDAVVEVPKPQCEIYGHTDAEINGKCDVCAQSMHGVYVADNGNMYCFEWNGAVRTGKIYITDASTNGIVKEGWYYTDANGRFLDKDFYDDNGTLRYIVNGKAYYNAGGAVEHDGKTYFIEWDGIVRTGKFYVTQASIDASAKDTSLVNGYSSGWYYTDENGALIMKGFYNDNGVKRYIENGKSCYARVLLYEGNYYMIEWDGRVVVNTERFYITAASVGVHSDNVNFGWNKTDENGIIQL